MSWFFSNSYFVNKIASVNSTWSCVFWGGLYHFVFCKVADALPDSTADEVWGVTEENGAAHQAGAGRWIFLDLSHHRLLTLLDLNLVGRQMEQKMNNVVITNQLSDSHMYPHSATCSYMQEKTYKWKVGIHWICVTHLTMVLICWIAKPTFVACKPVLR